MSQPTETPSFVHIAFGPGRGWIGPSPFEQLEKDSDRAAAIVAGSIVEQRLTEAIQRLMRNDQGEVLMHLFRPSGALGTFSTKIDVAFLLRVVSDEAFIDLRNICKIRNIFAHKFDIASFDAQCVRDRCKNFTLVDKHTFKEERSDDGRLGLPKVERTPMYGYTDHPDLIVKPRFRYVTTAQLISYRLGQGVLKRNPSLPFV